MIDDPVLKEDSTQKKYKRTRGKKKISRTKEVKQNRMIRRNKRKMRGMIETEWAAFETKPLPDLVGRRKEAESDSDSDSDSDCYKYCITAEPKIFQSLGT